MACDGRGRVPCESCSGTGGSSAPYMPSLNLFTVTICPTCMGKGRVAGRCVGCPACGAAKDKGETDTQGSLFKP